jgi:hypothetical protein
VSRGRVYVGTGNTLFNPQDAEAIPGLVRTLNCVTAAMSCDRFAAPLKV